MGRGSNGISCNEWGEDYCQQVPNNQVMIAAVHQLSNTLIKNKRYQERIRALVGTTPQKPKGSSTSPISTPLKDAAWR
jgi:hypothetical protein